MAAAGVLLLHGSIHAGPTASKSWAAWSVGPVQVATNDFPSSRQMWGFHLDGEEPHEQMTPEEYEEQYRELRELAETGWLRSVIKLELPDCDRRDIEQEVLCRLTALGPQRLAAIQSLRSYAAIMVRNVAIDRATGRSWISRRTVDVMGATVVDLENFKHGAFAPDPAIQFLEGRTLAECMSCVHSALFQLQPQHRRILEFVKLDGLTYKQCAERLGLTEGTVKTELRRAMEKLGQLVRESEYGNHRRSDEDEH